MNDPETESTGVPVSSEEPKRAWQAPTLEEIDFTATEVVPLPGAVLDGGFPYSIV